MHFFTIKIYFHKTLAQCKGLALMTFQFETLQIKVIINDSKCIIPGREKRTTGQIHWLWFVMFCYVKH